MGTPEPNQFEDLDKRTAQLRTQLAAKPSLFDILSPASNQKPDQATLEHNRLKSATRTGTAFAIALSIIGVIAAILDLSASSRSSSSGFLFVILLCILGTFGTITFTAIRLLRARILALESELRLLHERLSSETSETK